MRNDDQIRKFTSSGGVDVYKLPVEAFPKHFTNCYLVMLDPIVLIDTASGWEDSNKNLEEAFEHLRENFDEQVRIEDIGRIILTHGHIDHFGGLHFVRDRCGAEVGIHSLDRSVLQNFNERLIVSAHNLNVFLKRSGLSDKSVARLVDMNKWSKDTFKPCSVDFVIGEGAVLDTPLVAYHVPGHCPGQICLQLHDLLFTADHILSHVTPNQSPESITRYNGLGHYMESLDTVHDLDGIRVGLGGHELEVEDVSARAFDTLKFHEARLEKTLDALKEPKTVADTSLALFGERKNYDVLLAMLEAGAHLEYLYERGEVYAVNAEQVETAEHPVLLYQAV